MTPRAEVCLILEGTYPYVAGGVSSWVQDLIKAQSDLRFHLLTLMPDAKAKPLKYELPANVVGQTMVGLQDLRPGEGRLSAIRTVLRELEPALLDLQSKGGLTQLLAVMQALSSAPNAMLGSRALLNSPEAFDLLCRMYERTVRHTSFLDYFWTWRALLGGLYATLLCPLPEAAVYHAVSTGYAGLVAARAKIATRRPVLLTEHGIYTNERRIEIAMADWLFQESANFAIEKARRDLRDLWIDTFVSYSRACYEAADRIITLYGGNQVLQRRDGAPDEKLEIIVNGIDYAKYAATPRDPAPRPPAIALIGRVVPIKDVKTYIRAAAILRESVPDVVAYVLGPTEEDPEYFEECRVMVEHLGLEKTVVFAGRVALTDYLGKIDAIVLTSISEAQPLVILEAGAAGVPCVATDVGACREMLLGRPDEVPPLGAGGAVTPLADPTATAKALAQILRDPATFEACSRAIRERVKRHYNKVDIDRIYGALYRRAIDAPDGASLPKAA
jgi:glycosyltransferase involved in cell wall biosynthesis